jgi:hypothetical protein
MKGRLAGWLVNNELTVNWKGHVARMREKRNAFRLLVGKSEGKRPLGRPKRRWVDNIRDGSFRVGMGCAGHVAGMRRRGTRIGCSLESQREGGH